MGVNRGPEHEHGQRARITCRFWGLEKIHPFDSNKFRRIVQMLQTDGLVQPKQAKSSI